MRRLRKYCALGKLIAKRLVDLEQTQTWLAETSAIQLCMISKYCTGDFAPSTQSVYKLSVALGISTDEIIQTIMKNQEQVS